MRWTRTFRWMAVGSVLLGATLACSLVAPQGPKSGPTATPAVIIPPPATETASPPPTVETPPTLAPTSLPTGVLASPPIQAAEASQVQRVASIATGYTSQIVWRQDSQALGAIQEGGVVSYRFDPLEINTQYDVSEPQRILALSPDGATLALTADNTTIELVDPASGENRLSIPMGTPINSASFSPDGSVLAISSADVWQVSLVDPASGQLTATLTGFETAAPIYNAVFLGSSQKLVWFARARVQVQDIPSQALGPALEHEDFINGLALTTAGDLLVTLTSKSMNDSSSPVVQFWDPQTGADLGIYVLDTSGTAVAFSPDGQVLAVGAGADILLIDPVNRTLLATLAGEEGTSVTTLAFSPDGTALASTLDAGQLSIWRVQP